MLHKEDPKEPETSKDLRINSFSSESPMDDKSGIGKSKDQEESKGTSKEELEELELALKLKDPHNEARNRN